MTTKPAPAIVDSSVPPPEVSAVPSAQETISASHALVAQATAYPVTTTAQYAEAADILQRLRGAFRKLEEERLGITRLIDASKQRVMNFFGPHTTAIEQAAAILKGKMKAYDAEQQHIANEARRKAEAEAAAIRAEAERKAREQRELAEAEAQRRRDEEAARRREQEAAERRIREEREAEERAQREQADARRRGDEEAELRAREEENRARARRELDEEAARESQRAALAALAAADKVETRAEVKAEAHEVRATSVVAPVIAEPVKVAGIARRMVWKYKVKDEAAVKREFLILDDAKIAKIVKAMGKDAEAMVGGIECWQENDISARAR